MQRRSIIKYILLNIITYGIYSIVMLHKIGKEIEKICEDDSESYMSFVCAWLLGFVTFGIYPCYWWYKQTNRLMNHVYRYKGVITLPHSAVTVSAFWIMMNGVSVMFIIDNINQFAKVYGKIVPLEYTADVVKKERLIVGTGASVVSPTPTTKPGANYQPRGNAPMRKPSVVCVAGMYKGAIFDIDRNGLVFGSDPSVCSIIIESDSGMISSKHCTVTFDEFAGKYVVVDCSEKGTYIRSGERISPNQSAYLDRGSEIVLGNEQNIFRLD